MQLSSLIEVAIGLIFIYVLLSLVCSSLSEIIASILKLRSKTLKKGLERLITDKKTLDEFYAHPLVKSLCKQSSDSEKVTASYIPSRIFAAASGAFRAFSPPHCVSLYVCTTSTFCPWA